MSFTCSRILHFFPFPLIFGNLINRGNIIIIVSSVTNDNRSSASRSSAKQTCTHSSTWIFPKNRETRASNSSNLCQFSLQLWITISNNNLMLPWTMTCFPGTVQQYFCARTKYHYFPISQQIPVNFIRRPPGTFGLHLNINLITLLQNLYISEGLPSTQNISYILSFFLLFVNSFCKIAQRS